MPRQLPGFYWDDHKQRFFPLATRQTHSETPSSTTRSDRSSCLLSAPHHALVQLRSVLHTVHKDVLIHQIQSSQISLTDKLTQSSIPSNAPISAFQSVSHNGRVWNFAGNTLGWFYSATVLQGSDSPLPWQPNLFLSSEVSSICISGATCVATTFGPECTILYAPLDFPVEGIHKIAARVAHDVWTADLLNSCLVLGANKQAVVIEDIAVFASLRRLPTQSDVFALAQREHVLYTGLRNGGILRFDTRIQNSNSHPLFDITSQPTSSITGLKHLRDRQLVASFMDGGMSTFDLRFPIRTPLVTFTGNFNRYTVKLPLVTDPYERFLFAAGQDNRIRVWSLFTGGAALDPAGGVFQRPFQHSIAALQVVEEREGMHLWAASGTELCKYSLGHRSGICT